MVNINKQVTYWTNSAQEDRDVAENLYNMGKNRHALFFLHLSFEKLIKALVCRSTNQLAPKSHNLLMLLERADISVPEKFSDLFAEINSFNLEGRYPETHLPPPDKDYTASIFYKTEEAWQWLKELL